MYLGPVEPIDPATYVMPPDGWWLQGKYMSKQSKKRHRKHRKHRDRLTWQILCPRCGSVEDGTVPSMLTAIMDILNSCRDYGVKVKIHHGVILAEGHDGGGYVLPLPDGHFTARDMTYDRFAQVPAVDDDLDD